MGQGGVDAVAARAVHEGAPHAAQIAQPADADGGEKQDRENRSGFAQRGRSLVRPHGGHRLDQRDLAGGEVLHRDENRSAVAKSRTPDRAGRIHRLEAVVGEQVRQDVRLAGGRRGDDLAVPVRHIEGAAIGERELRQSLPHGVDLRGGGAVLPARMLQLVGDDGCDHGQSLGRPGNGGGGAGPPT